MSEQQLQCMAPAPVVSAFRIINWANQITEPLAPDKDGGVVRRGRGLQEEEQILYYKALEFLQTYIQIATATMIGQATGEAVVFSTESMDDNDAPGPDEQSELAPAQ